MLDSDSETMDDDASLSVNETSRLSGPRFELDLVLEEGEDEVLELRWC